MSTSNENNGSAQTLWGYHMVHWLLVQLDRLLVYSGFCFHMFHYSSIATIKVFSKIRDNFNWFSY